MMKSGAPKGGRVHWLLWHLPSWFKNYYMLSYSYDKHNYVFYRLNNRRLIDVFIVYQSSLHYWRMAYVNLEKQHSLICSFSAISFCVKLLAFNAIFILS